MNTILEQVARAICKVQYLESGITHYGHDADIFTVDRYVNEDWKEYTNEAKAAIQALIDADWPASISKSIWGLDTSEGWHAEQIEIIKSMLQQILNEPDRG